MRYGITLLGERVAPRSTCADAVLIVAARRSGIRTVTTVTLSSHSLLDLAKTLADNRVDTLVCGGISREERDFLAARHIATIDNVVGSVDELVAALDSGTLSPGFGLGSADHDDPNLPSGQPAPDHHSPTRSADCLACRDRVCLNGKRCDLFLHTRPPAAVEHSSARMMEAAIDVSFEHERTLCRLSELIYFCLEMHYHRIGLAYCIDLEEPVEILVRVLRRFFEVYPVCCKIGGRVMPDTLYSPASAPVRSAICEVACNPAGQAEVLNRIETDFNIIAGLCVGADCLFAQLSDAPVTTLFVRDKSLANNPIGAVYSDYYLKEAMQAAARTASREP